MKLINIFRKKTKLSSKSNIEALEKNQLRAVIGGTDKITEPTRTTAHELTHVKQE